MESETSRKKKKSVAFHPNHGLNKEEMVGEVYRAASIGHPHELKELLEKMDSHIIQDELEDIILNIYTELKLNNIALTDDVEVQLYKYFWKNCFTSKRSIDGYKISDIKNHIKTLSCIVDCIQYFADEEEKLIFCLKFSIKKIYFLKHLLRSTYAVLPWEEIEFYLLGFIILSTEQHDLNVFFKTALNKSDLIEYLTDFVKSLEKLQIEEKNELSKLPELTRDEAVRKIIAKFPNFRKLYEDIEFIRDIYYLDKIKKFAKFSQSIDPQEFRCADIIVRILCVISEQLKYTLESPKLSPIKGDLIILSLTGNSRSAILDLRNAVEWEETILLKEKLIKDSNENFLKTVRDDLKQIAQVSEYLLLGQIIRLLRNNLQNVEDYPDVLKQMETVFPLLDILSNSVITDKTLYDRLYENLKELPSEIQTEGNFLSKMKKIVETKTELKNFEKGNILAYILKPEARDIFVNHVLCTRLSSADINKIKIKNWRRDEIGVFIAEVINLLVLEIDNVDDWRGKFEEAIKINRMLFLDEKKKSKPSSEKLGIDYKKLTSKRISTLRKVMNNKSQLSYAKLKNDHKSLEILKSLVLDILTISNIEADEEARSRDSQNQNHSMIMEWLKTDYELNDLIFNSTITVFHVANSLIENDLQHLRNTINNSCKVARNRNSFNDQFIFICKKLKICSKLEQDDFENFKQFFKRGADIRARDVTQSTYLHIAAEKSVVSQIDYFYKEGLSVYCKNFKLQTPLHIAAKSGNEQGVLYFIQKAKDVVDYVDDFGRSALHLAVLNGRQRIVQCLVNEGSDPCKKDLLGVTSSVYAVLDKNKEVLSILLGNKKNISTQQNDLETLINIAIHQNSTEIVDFLLSEKCRTFDYQILDIAMSSAVSNGQVEIVATLLSHGARPTKNSILIAVQKNYDLIVEQLLQNETKVANAVDSENGMTPLHYAAQNGNDYIVDILMQHKANIKGDKKKNTPLHIAVENRHVNIVKTLLRYKKGEEVINAMNFKRYTALHIAAETGQLEIATLLLDTWAFLDNEEFLVTPLHLAKSNGNEEIVKLLLKNGAPRTKTLVPSNSNVETTSKRTWRKDMIVGRASGQSGITLTKKILDNPTIIIRGVDQDDGSCSNEELINKIIEQNKFEKNIKYKQEIVGKYMKHEKFNIILVLEKSVYNEIMSKKYLKIGWNLCSVSDYYCLFRCYNCAGFGHNEVDCENEQVCRRCSESHGVDECTSKKFKCFYCIEKKESTSLNLDVEHSPMDQFCPWYRKLLKDKYEKQKKSCRPTNH